MSWEQQFRIMALVDEACSISESIGRDRAQFVASVRSLILMPPTTDFPRLKTVPYDEFLRSPEWFETRRRARVLAGGRCQGCNSPNNLETHHRTYERRGYEDIEDLTVLCSACHTAVHLVMDARAGKERKTSRRAEA